MERLKNAGLVTSAYREAWEDRRKETERETQTGKLAETETERQTQTQRKIRRRETEGQQQDRAKKDGGPVRQTDRQADN